MNRIGAAAAAMALAQAAVANAQSGPAWVHEPWTQAPDVEVQHAAARVVVLAEPRRNISVTVEQGRSRLPPLAVRQEGGGIVVEGGFGRFSGNDGLECSGEAGRRWVSAPGYGRVAYEDLPLVVAHVPLDARVIVEGAVYGQASATRSLGLVNRGCGDWTVGTVKGSLEAALSSSGALKAADAGQLKAYVAGSSDVAVGHVLDGAAVALSGSGGLHALTIGGALDVQATGSGGLTVDSIDGPVLADIGGSGDVRLRGGNAPEVKVRVSGSGEFQFGGQAGRVQAVASGSSDIRIPHARGPVTQVSSGSSQIDIGR